MARSIDSSDILLDTHFEQKERKKERETHPTEVKLLHAFSQNIELYRISLHFWRPIKMFAVFAHISF